MSTVVVRFGLLVPVVLLAVVVMIVAGSFTPVGEQILYSSAPGWQSGYWAVHLIDVDRGIAQRLAPSETTSNPGLPARWSGDGRYVAYMEDTLRLNTFVIDASGRSRQRLSGDRQPLRASYEAVWSPDGSVLAFVGWLNGEEGIYMADADGSNVRPLTRKREYVLPGGDSSFMLTAQRRRIGFRNLSWSPDGSTLAFESWGSANDIWVIEVEGSPVRRLTNHRSWDMKPTWSPDGTQIAFMSGYESAAYLATNQLDLWVMDANGDNRRRLTRNQIADSEWVIRWSPDGTKIVFGSDAWFGGEDIYLVDVAAGESINVTDDPDFDANPVWSPDSSRLIFSSRRTGTWQLEQVDADGTSRQLLLQNHRDIRDPIFSPDGTRIAFMSNLARSWDIYVMDAYGRSRPRRLTFDSGIEFSPLWRPVVEK